MDRLIHALQERFGLEAFRPWQREAVEAVMDDPRQALVVAPTGGGKSLTYQLPAVLLKGTVLVVSPLIALMEDQVRALQERGIASTYLASTLSSQEREARERRLLDGDLDLLYLAPERLASDRTLRLLSKLQPPMIAIDEAHCISQWGHDFRPDYLRIGRVLESLRPRHVLACTATATPIVRDEIVERLGMQEAKVVLRGFARPNLHLSVQHIDVSSKRKRIVRDSLAASLGDSNAPNGAAIVYSSTRRGAENAAKQISEHGYRTGVYHGGMAADDRMRVNREFGQGALHVVAATNAFGMGIDRADIRLVLHTQAPGSIEAYYQEVGRAGRDGEPAHGILLSGSSDLGLRRRLIERSYDVVQPSQSQVDRQWQLFLDLMRYAEAGSCRHDFILRYFGDDEEVLGGCGHCDVCAGLVASANQDQEEAQRLVRMGLSAIARVRGTVGLKAVAQMLAGRSNQMLQRWELDQLSTFGLMKDRDVDWIVALLRRLITAGYVGIEGAEYPKPVLVRRGIEVMKGQREPEVLLPPATRASAKKSRSRSQKAAATEQLRSEDQATYEALRQVRLTEAKRQGVAAFMVCSNRTLVAMAVRRPSTQAELLDIPGIGPAKAESYGALFLEAIRSADS